MYILFNHIIRFNVFIGKFVLTKQPVRITIFLGRIYKSSLKTEMRLPKTYKWTKSKLIVHFI